MVDAGKTKMNSEKKEPGENNRSKSYTHGGYFLIGEMPPMELFISEEWSEEQRMIKEMLEDFCMTEIQQPFLQRGRELNVTNNADREEVIQLLRKAAALGLCGVSIPEAYGGMGLDFTTNTLVSEYLSLGYSFATTLGAQTSIGCLPIVYYGTEVQREKYLPKIATGEYIAAYALTEPNAGSDANAGRTTATVSADGQHYVLNGQKIWITNGGIADVYIVFAKIDGDENLSAFIVERTYPGFSVGPEEKKMGIKGSSTVQIYFDHCQVPIENLLGVRNQGFKMALNILNSGRIKAGAGGVGGSKFALTKAVQYANERRQFGQPIAQFGAIQYKIGELAARTFAVEAALYRTAQLIDLKTAELQAQGLPEHEARVQSIREFAVEASIIKVKGSDLVCETIDETLQIYGGMGYAQETGIEMGYRDARITKIYEGTNEINRLLSVGELAKRALQTKEIDLMSAGKKIPVFLLQSFFAVNTEERMVQALKNVFLFLFGAAGKKMGKKLIEEQEIVLQLSNILADAYVADSALLKVRKLRRMGGDEERLAVQQQMLQLYLYRAVENTRRTAREIIDSYEGSRRDMRLVNRMLGVPVLNPKKIRRNIADYLSRCSEYPF